MIDELRAISIFAEVIRQGSFRATAKSLDLSPSVVSYHITQLEKRLGTPLIYRSTRKLSLTEDGKTLYRHAEDMLRSAQLGISHVSRKQKEPEGTLVVTAPAALAGAPLNHQLADFARRYSQIELKITYSDERKNLIEEGIDIAIRAGHLKDSSLKAKPLGEIQRKLVCSPEYFSGHKPPQHPKDLASWHWIKLAMLPDKRTLLNQHGHEEIIQFQSRICVDKVDALANFAAFGLGLATPPDYMVNDLIRRQALIEVLPQWQVKPIPLHAVWPGNIAENSNTKRLLHFLSEAG